MTYVKIPHLSRSQDAEPLARCIEVASQKCGVSQYTTTLLLTHVLEELARQVACGRVVRIPGFGAFGAELIENAASVARWGSGRCKPAFSPARGFREEVRWGVPNASSTKRQLTRHRRNHSLGSGESRLHNRVFSSMDAIRKNINAQLRGVRLED